MTLDMVIVEALNKHCYRAGTRKCLTIKRFTFYQPKTVCKLFKIEK